jgi:uncharacterized protein (DUF2236 family)
MAERRSSPGDSRAITHARRLRSREGYFAPESVIRRLGNTPLVPFLGGGPAVLLQVAHPLVAAGVIDHSEVGSDLWRRLVQTLRALYLIAFGTKEEAERAAEMFSAGILDPDVFISHRLPLEQYADALDMFRAGKGRKIQVRPRR